MVLHVGETIREGKKLKEENFEKKKQSTMAKEKKRFLGATAAHRECEQSLSKVAKMSLIIFGILTVQMVTRMKA